ncbi:MAG: hypothetical protein ACLQF1_00880 [Methyloceanibacter sp.]
MTRERLKQKVTSQNLTRPYEPTPEERTAVHAFFARKKRTPPSPSLKVSKKGQVAEVSLDHPEPGTGQLLLMHALGSTDPAFVNGLLTQLANASSKGRDTDESGLNFMLSVVKAIEPKDEVETMIAAQMAAIHVATMTFARRLNHVENIPQQDSAERAFNKLARTFASQVEALKRYRTGGEQKVTVEHVHVHEGGQAIVGHVEQGAGRVLKPEG